MYSENDDVMESLSVAKRRKITFDRNHRISGASEQSF